MGKRLDFCLRLVECGMLVSSKQRHLSLEGWSSDSVSGLRREAWGPQHKGHRWLWERMGLAWEKGDPG